MDIHFIFTGGTIDSSYYPPTETAEPNAESIIPHYIQDVIKPHVSFTYETVCMKDSGDLTPVDRASILAAIKKAKAGHILISHGTSTMVRTAEYLDKELKGTDKIVVLTGAMIPLKEFAQSDAGFNLGFAVAALSNLESGVYICMNAKVFKAGTSVKDIKNARFEVKS